MSSKQKPALTFLLDYNKQCNCLSQLTVKTNNAHVKAMPNPVANLLNGYFLPNVYKPDKFPKLHNTVVQLKSVYYTTVEYVFLCLPYTFQSFLGHSSTKKLFNIRGDSTGDKLNIPINQQVLFHPETFHSGPR